MNYSRIQKAFDINLLQNTHIIGVGAGGAYSYYESLVRSGIGKLTVLDFDTVDDVNYCRQGFIPSQEGMYKVDALKEHLLSINPELKFTGITKNYLDMGTDEIDEIFRDGDLFLFLTDSFNAQAGGNILATSYQKPAIWGGFYEKSECMEIVFYIPGVTPACFRCAVLPRYEFNENIEEPLKISSEFNTIFHSQMLDSILGVVTMAILHNNTEGYSFSNWFGNYWDRNLFQFKIDPNYESELFDNILIATGGRSMLFTSNWQKIPHDSKCKDCCRS